MPTRCIPCPGGIHPPPPPRLMMSRGGYSTPEVPCPGGKGTYPLTYHPARRDTHTPKRHGAKDTHSPPSVDRQTPVKTSPSRNFVYGWLQKNNFRNCICGSDPITLDYLCRCIIVKIFPVHTITKELYLYLKCEWTVELLNSVGLARILRNFSLQ